VFCRAKFFFFLSRRTFRPSSCSRDSDSAVSCDDEQPIGGQPAALFLPSQSEARRRTTIKRTLCLAGWLGSKASKDGRLQQLRSMTIASAQH